MIADLYLNPNDKITYFDKGYSIYILKMYEDSLICYNMIIDLGFRSKL